MSRYPMPLPFSWYTIYHADQLKPQDVVPLRYFGRDLVLFRTQSGKPQLLDAFCPHLGAHLGVGGFVEGESVVCPFHNWAWDGSGKCTSIPYADKMPPRMNTLRIRHYELIEKNQMIYAWFHPENKKPFLDMPEISQTTEAQWGPPKRFRWTMKVHIQEMAENAVDAAHFKYVHGAKSFPEWDVKLEGPTRTATMRFKSQTPEGMLDCQIISSFYTPGNATTHFTGIADILLMVMTSPIDAETTDVRFDFYRKKDSEGQLSKYGDAFMEEICRQVEEDQPIWENKAFCPRPVLCDNDGKIMEFRRHYSQFYVNYDEKERVQEMTRTGQGRLYLPPST